MAASVAVVGGMRAALTRTTVIAMLMLGLSACVGGAVKRPAGETVVPAADAAQREAARAQRVRAGNEWSLTGRIAVSNAGKGGSGRIEWTQRGERFEVALSAPVTRQSWRLAGGPGEARLEGLEGGPRSGDNAAALLLETTGWDIPVEALGNWLRGLPAEGGAAAKLAPGPDGRPLSIEQGGWTIAYQWPASGDLPSRLDARRASARVRLIVDEWQGGAAAAPVASRDKGWESLQSNVVKLRNELATLNLDDPAGDARADLAQGRARLIGMCGFSCLTPGLEGGDSEGVDGVHYLDGTSDVIEGDEHARLLEQATRYAIAYNQSLGAGLKANAASGATAAHAASASR
ncbi:lipoprotein insertase outer membrane protein LolB [Lysobacter capsici]|uniref:lipoprotein insertase outer membrane protein LolB n=1 Tax=Lysobacter capsici TaxID=435897 RepID=UPI000B180900|nr:lipoprotein insertase outer membrane protein LolB [Lysobacter capsici]